MTTTLREDVHITTDDGGIDNHAITPASPTPLSQQVMIGDAKALAGLFKKMSLVLGQLKRLEKSRTNTNYNFRYTPIDDVKEAVRKAFADVELSFLSVMAAHRVKPAAKGVVAEVDMLFIICDTETGATITTPWTGRANDSNGDYAIPKAIAFAIKYYLLTTFLMSTGEELDGDSGDSAAAASGEQLASPEVLAQIASMWKKSHPQWRNKSDQDAVFHVFDAYVAEGCDLTQINAAIVIGKLFDEARKEPPPAPVESKEVQGKARTTRVEADPTPTQG